MFENEQAVMPLLADELGPFAPPAIIVPVESGKLPQFTPMLFQLLKFVNARFDRGDVRGDVRGEFCKKHLFDHY